MCSSEWKIPANLPKSHKNSQWKKNFIWGFADDADRARFEIFLWRRRLNSTRVHRDLDPCERLIRNQFRFWISSFGCVFVLLNENFAWLKFETVGTARNGIKRLREKRGKFASSIICILFYFSRIDDEEEISSSIQMRIKFPHGWEEDGMKERKWKAQRKLWSATNGICPFIGFELFTMLHFGVGNSRRCCCGCWNVRSRGEIRGKSESDGKIWSDKFVYPLSWCWSRFSHCRFHFDLWLNSDNMRESTWNAKTFSENLRRMEKNSGKLSSTKKLFEMSE